MYTGGKWYTNYWCLYVTYIKHYQHHSANHYQHTLLLLHLLSLFHLFFCRLQIASTEKSPTIPLSTDFHCLQMITLITNHYLLTNTASILLQ